MSMDHAASVQGLGLRVTRLGLDGRPLAGDNTSFFTTSFISLGFTPEYSEGDEIEEKAADGSVCISYKMPDTLKNVTISLAICNPDPELYQLLVGGEAIVAKAVDGTIAAGDVVGYRAPDIGTVESTPVAVEVWSKAIVGGKLSSKLPYYYWVFPSATFRMTGDRVLENGAMANEFEGSGVGNGNFAMGPLLEGWKYGPTDRAYQYARVASVPTVTNGFQVVAASSTAGTDNSDPTHTDPTAPNSPWAVGGYEDGE